MKKKLISIIIGTTILCMCACGNREVVNSETNEEPVTIQEEEADKPVAMQENKSEEPATENQEEQFRLVMVDGILYYDTGKESTLEGRCGMMDGEITSSVDASEIPNEDNQSNFGSGFGYQYGFQNSIDIQMEDGKWIVFQRQGTEYVEDIAITEDVKTEPEFIRMENPSWKYYIAQEVPSETKPFMLKVVEETANEIIDTEEWFTDNDLQLIGNSDEEEYGCYVDYDDIIIVITRNGTAITELEFTEYLYAPDMNEEYRDYVDERILDAKVRDGILYVAISHPTYSAFAPSNAYMMAISLEDYSVIWKSEPLVCNSYNFEVVDDVIFCGYGFTEEDDYLYQVDRLTGAVLDKYKLMSKPDYIIYKDGKLYIRTYNTNYVMEVSR